MDNERVTEILFFDKAGSYIDRHTQAAFPNGPQSGPTGAQPGPNCAQLGPNRGPHGMLLGIRLPLLGFVTNVRLSGGTEHCNSVRG